jgi:2-polyprenyl-3-methyl-5-hydroxy-6-metoxy-1,4-benzoquinol methylase
MFLLLTALIPFSYLFKKDPIVALYSIPVQLCRNFFWAFGSISGLLNSDTKNMPNENKWDSFWNNKRDSRFTRKSWSKIRMTKLLDQVTEKGMAVLDVGCGSGFFSNYFIYRGCRVYSLDYSKEAIKITKELTHNRSEGYLQDDIMDSGFGKKYSKKFDLIFSDGLLEHFSVNDQKKILDNLKAVKKPDGIITTFVPNKYSWWEIIRPIFMPGIAESPFTMKKLKRFFRDMKIIKFGGLNSIPCAFSPDRLAGSYFGMILYLFSK